MRIKRIVQLGDDYLKIIDCAKGTDYNFRNIPQTKSLQYLLNCEREMEEHGASFTILRLFVLSLLIFSVLQVEAQRQRLVPALYIFGDSTIDPGNNNGLVTEVKADFPPYGKDFPNGRATGRFTNGRLVTDIISELLGLPDLLPASEDPEFQGERLLTGASFGSSASGYVLSTAIELNVLPLVKQIDNFRHYKVRLANLIGQEKASNLVSEALFAISSGSDDFALNYYINPLRRKEYTVEQFQDIMLKTLTRFIQDVYNEGARKLAVIGLPPFGCLPAQITLNNLKENTCVERFNEVARSFNSKERALIERMAATLPGLRIGYVDIYDKLNDMVKNHSKYGFEEARKGCCGTGLLEISILCKVSKICPDASKYVFWDSFHPTTAAYVILGNDVFQKFTRLLV